MTRIFSNLRGPEVPVRILCDFAVVHAAAYASLTSVLLWRSLDTPGLDARAMVEDLRSIYLSHFVPLSLVFPIVFALCGFYSHARSLRTPYKWRAIARGSVAATLTYLFADFLLTRVNAVPRSSTVLFLALVVAGTVGVRWLKQQIADPVQEEPQRVSITRSEGAPVLVVGGAGYIGSVLCRDLLARGHRVRVLDSSLYGDRGIADLASNPRFELISGDCRNIQSVVSAVRGVDSIVHLAAIVGDPACDQDRSTALETNYAATRMLIEVARGNRVRRFVFASSCSVYGAAGVTMSEQSRVEPVSLYARTKVDSERALLEAAGVDFHPTILRLATVFGYSPRPRFDLVVNLLVAKAFAEGVITVFNGQQWRPFIHVSDVSRGIATVLDAPLGAISGEVLNLGDSRLNYTLADLAGYIQREIPDTRVERVDNNDRRDYRVSFEKIHNRLGFECETGLEQGVSELAQLLRTGVVADYMAPEFHNQRFLRAIGTAAHGVDARVMAAFAYETLETASHAAAGS